MINIVADYLQGTCNSLEDGLAFIGLTFDTTTIEQFDEITMCCDECGWWCPTEEFSNDDQICDECHGGK